MVKSRGSGTMRLFVAILVAGGASVGLAQSGQPLTALTVPAAGLPDGCALTKKASEPVPVLREALTAAVGSATSRIPTNPWSGTDRATMAAIHFAIDGAQERAVPDVRPLDPREVEASKLKWSDHVVEAYHAAYESADGHSVEVFAVTFDDAALTPAPESVAAMLNPSRALAGRIILGATVVRVSAPTATGCARAVEGYIRSRVAPGL